MSKETLNNLEEVFNNLKSNFDTSTEKIKVNLVYAFNGTGKTRISRMFTDLFEDKALCFNSMFQDEFSWNNSNSILVFNINSWIAKFIKEQGLENDIEKNFQIFCDDSIEASLDLEHGFVEFSARTIEGYDYNIKISKAEESIFIWSVFYSFVDLMIYELKENQENRSTNIFDNIEYLIIDDPVSSIDDIKILNIAIKIFELIERMKELLKKTNILVTTHHALFYNSIYNLLNREKGVILKSYILSKRNYTYLLTEKGDSPFGYHLNLINKIHTAINENTLEKIHFNMFRIILEKTSNYFGYRKYDECIPDNNYKKEIIKLVNLYSHGNLPEFEYSNLTEHEKNIFIESFNDFINYYKVEVKDE